MNVSESKSIAAIASLCTSGRVVNLTAARVMRRTAGEGLTFSTVEPLSNFAQAHNQESVHVDEEDTKDVSRVYCPFEECNQNSRVYFVCDNH